MPNTNKIRELVKAISIILASDETAITNLTVETRNIKRARLLPSKKEEHIVISFDKDMSVSQCMKYLRYVKDRIIEKFCGEESAAGKLFYTGFFPFNFDSKNLTEDNKFLIPMKDEVVFNLKHLLANHLARGAISTIMEDFGEEYVEEKISDESYNRDLYLYCIRFYDQELRTSFVKSLLSRIKIYENGPKDFLKVRDDFVYIKKGIFNNLEFIKDIVKREASIECRYFETPNTEDEALEDQKFLLIDLFRKAGMSVDFIWRDSYLGSDENSILIPAVNDNNYLRTLKREEVDRINKIFGMAVLNNVEGHTSQESLSTFSGKGVYGIDFSNPDISYCVMNKIIETSVINKDYKLSIDPERVPVMQLPTETQTPKIENDPLSNHGSSYYGPSGSFDVDSHGDLSDQEEVLSSGSSSSQTPCSSLNSPNSQAAFIPLLR